MTSPLRFLGAGLVCAAGDDPAAVAAKLRAGVPAPVELTLPDLGLGGRFLYYPTAFPAGTERALRLAEAAAADALARSGLSAEQRGRTALFLGSSSMDVASAECWLHDRPQAQAVLFGQLGGGGLAAAVAARLGLGGGSYGFSAACSSAVTALLAAADLVACGEIEHALVVGVETYNQISLQGFNSLMLLSGSGCRPFSACRDGMVLGEGAAACVIGRGDGGWRLLGGANRSDTGNVTRSSSAGMIDTMTEALARAGVAPERIAAVKAHGTGTAANDEAEGQALRAVFGDALPPVSSLKPMLGYTLGASGLLELVAWMACVDAGFLPPTPGFGAVDPDAGISPLTAAQPAGAGAYLLNCFGFGGNNTALVVDRD